MDECEWVQEDWDSETYDTSCGMAFSTIDGSLGENNIKYCPFCGKPIKETPSQAEKEGE